MIVSIVVFIALLAVLAYYIWTKFIRQEAPIVVEE